MDAPTRPIFLFADSQLLFWSGDGELFLNRARALLTADEPKAAYVGASNGDRPEFYQLFQSAMEGIGIGDCRMIPSEPSAEDLEYFDAADLVLLAGGDVERGWRAFERNGLKDRVIERYYQGALLIGISAGAVQLGLQGLRGDADTAEYFETFKLIPLVIDVHEEPEWTRLEGTMPEIGELAQGIGIPSGAGAVVHPDMTVEPVRRSLVELSLRGGEVHRSVILPPDSRAQPPGSGAAVTKS
ncbi:MAG: type 1 glutamine amidotransferase-like domain-containing protein [bacterium]|nr:type 1 glutamine amidotransferase-like domain-containing protein [bacterium]